MFLSMGQAQSFIYKNPPVIPVPIFSEVIIGIVESENDKSTVGS